MRELWISGRDSLRVLVRAALWGVLLFALGFIPFVGQTVVPVVGFFVTGFFLTEELTSVALQRRGVELRDRLALLRSRKTLVWGYGTPLAVSFLVPFVAVFLMPGAVAGATSSPATCWARRSGTATRAVPTAARPPGRSAPARPVPPVRLRRADRHRHDRPHLRDDVQPVAHERGVGDRPRRRVGVPLPEPQHRCVDVPARQGAAQPETVPQQGRPVGDLVGEVVPAAARTGRRAGRRPVRPHDRLRAARRISVTLVLSYTGKRPVSAAVIASYGSVVVVHCGCGPGPATGTVSVRETFSLSGKPPRQAPLVRSTSNRPTRPWLTVVNRSTRGRCGRSASSTARA